ncbi:hypothetical protein J4558_20375 [Leptolyngbya sp. 15MV]|nr:hypothetical protein J4558_20375 [Leptolyngbya sp. 15MV]
MRALAAIAALALAAPAGAGSLYVETGRLLDPRSGEVTAGQCILVEAGRVARIEPCAATPQGVERIDWSAFTVLLVGVRWRRRRPSTVDPS